MEQTLVAGWTLYRWPLTLKNKIEKVEYKNKGLVPKYYLQSVDVDQKAQPIGLKTIFSSSH